MNRLVVVRGGGDIATGTIYKLRQCGFSVLVLEAKTPSAIRRKAAFSEAVYESFYQVEDMTCYFASSNQQARQYLNDGKLVVLIDPQGDSISYFKPDVVVDAILAKKNLGTSKAMAPLTIGLGPGFYAGKDVDVVIETMRSHQLGKLLYHGNAIKNTATPGTICGYGKERVIHSPAAGRLKNISSIGDTVTAGQTIAVIDTDNGQKAVAATINGLLRGLIRDGFLVTAGLKIADIDPRIEEYNNCFTISDKARCIAGGVLEAICHYFAQKENETL